VGDFVASFVPKVDDFDRLDPHSSIPKEVWNKISGEFWSTGRASKGLQPNADTLVGLVPVPTSVGCDCCEVETSSPSGRRRSTSRVGGACVGHPTS
jgi:hypothetical protein